jgi:hypothetical protein
MDDARMAAFVFNCPSTGFNVQHWVDDDMPIAENEYDVITCQACARVHLINRKTGKLLGQTEQMTSH